MNLNYENDYHIRCYDSGICFSQCNNNILDGYRLMCTEEQSNCEVVLAVASILVFCFILYIITLEV